MPCAFLPLIQSVGFEALRLTRVEQFGGDED